MNFISLFSGIGGIDLGLEHAGWTCIAQVEIDAWCRRVLAKHWPDVERFEDVSNFDRSSIDGFVDLIAGGFPCQDISQSGFRAGLSGSRSGLWREFCRIIRDFRPAFVLVENVAALLVPDRTGVAPVSVVLGDLAACGYDAEWDCFPASAFGAYHERDRAFVVAYPARVDGGPHDLLEAGSERGASLQSRRLLGMAVAARGEREGARLGPEPELDRLVRRIPGAMDRLEAIGNSVYPAVAEWIGHRIGACITHKEGAK